MKNCWLHSGQSSRLILFFAGWGSSPAYFDQMVAHDWDVWMFYDYRSAGLPDDFEQTMALYDEVALIGWSFGVSMANHLCKPWQSHFSQAVAINGTLNPVDDREGIPVAIFNGTLQGLNPQGLLKFNRRMVVEKDHGVQIAEASKHRPFNEVSDELVCFSQLMAKSENCLFIKALIGTQDRIFPPDNQMVFWGNRVESTCVELGHFVFFNLTCWDDLLTPELKCK